MLTLLLVGMLTLAFNIQLVASSGPPPTKWTRTYGGANSECASSVIRTRDRGYAIAGYTGSWPLFDFWLVKTDSLGNMEWSKTYGGGAEDRAHSVMQTSDEGYIVAGYTDSFGAGRYDFWLVKTNSSGDMEWNKAYGGTGDEEAYSVVQTSDGGYAIAGAGYGDFWLVKTNSSGDMEWNQTYGGGGSESACSVVQTSGGGYAIAGTTMSFGAGETDFWLVRTDSSGNWKWDKTYGGPYYDFALSLVQTTSGGYALAGFNTTTGAVGTRDALVVETDSGGKLLWSQKWGGEKDDEAASLVQTPEDLGYAIAGTTVSFGAGAGDFWLIKIGYLIPVGGLVIPLDKFGLLAPYIAYASTILVATAATAIYVKRVNHRQKKK